MDRIAFDRLGTFKGDESIMRDGNGRIVQASAGDVVVYRCDECGALVNNTAMHEVWHGGQIGHEE